MTFTLRTHRMPRLTGITLLSLLALGACSADDALSPGSGRPASLTLVSSGSTSLASLGDTARLSPRVLDAAGRVVTGARVIWSVSMGGVVVPDGEGIYRAVTNGRATVIATIDVSETGVHPAGYWAEPLVDSAVIEVRQRPARLTLGAIDTAFTRLGTVRQLHAAVTDARGNPIVAALAPVSWESSDARIVAVDTAGVVRSSAEGTAGVTAHVEALSAVARFTVNPRLVHTSCMTYGLRRRVQQSCVTLDFVMRERGEGK